MFFSDVPELQARAVPRDAAKTDAANSTNGRSAPTAAHDRPLSGLPVAFADRLSTSAATPQPIDFVPSPPHAGATDFGGENAVAISRDPTALDTTN